jgi:hypothetical protein
MTSSAPRLSPRLVEAIRRADDGKLPIAELWREAYLAAERLELQRPSYEAVRLVVHAHRRFRRLNRTTADVVRDILVYERPFEDLLRHHAGLLPPPPL